MYDVVVSGAGPAGSYSAYKCAKGGLKVLLIEKDQIHRRKCCAGGLLGRATRALDFTLPDEVVEREVKGFSFVIDGTRYRFPIGKELAVTVRRERFDAFLIRKAEEQGVEMIMGLKVTHAIDNGQHVKIYSDLKEFEARFLIIADGASSPLADAMCGERRSPLRPLGCAVEVSCGETPRDEIDLHIASYARSLKLPSSLPLSGAIFPLKSSVMVSFIAGGRTKADFDRAIADAVSGIEREYGQAILAGKPCFHPLPIAHRPRLHSKRALVVGDAAGFVSPFSGEGLTSAFQSADLASRTLIQAQAAKSPDLSQYDRMCGRTILPRLRAARFIGPMLHYALNVVGHERLIANLSADDSLIRHCYGFSTGEIGLGSFAKNSIPRIPGLVLGTGK